MSTTIQNVPLTPQVGRSQTVQTPSDDQLSKTNLVALKQPRSRVDTPASRVDLSPQAIDSLTTRAPYLVTTDPAQLGLNPKETAVMQELRSNYFNQLAPGVQPEINVGVRPKDVAQGPITIGDDAQEVLETPPEGQVEDFVSVSETFNPDQIGVVRI